MSTGPEIRWNWVQGEEDDNKGAKVDFIRNVVACEMYNLHAIQIIEEEKRENRTEINEILLTINFPQTNKTVKDWMIPRILEKLKQDKLNQTKQSVYPQACHIPIVNNQRWEFLEKGRDTETSLDKLERRISLLLGQPWNLLRNFIQKQ